jgi:hypothetical protein
MSNKKTVVEVELVAEHTRPTTAGWFRLDMLKTMETVWTYRHMYASCEYRIGMYMYVYI